MVCDMGDKKQPDEIASTKVDSWRDLVAAGPGSMDADEVLRGLMETHRAGETSFALRAIAQSVQRTKKRDDTNP
jgi:hypothetical protein